MRRRRKKIWTPLKKNAGYATEQMKKKFKESPRVIDRGTSAHFCVSDQYLISKVLRIK